MFFDEKVKRDFASAGIGRELFPDTSDILVLPGFCDVHVHFREPGFSYKATVARESRASAAGGFTDVCTMPNLKPVPDSGEHLQEELDIIAWDAVIGVHPYAALTVGEMGREAADIEGLREMCIGYSDDGHGVQDDDLMRRLMARVKAVGGIIAAHCEVNSLLHGGCVHDGGYARAHDLPGICSESEWRMIERDLKLAEETGCRYHVCHISCRESVELIRAAKKRGVDVTCETGPHYLTMCDEDLEADGRFKMNPPLRAREDMLALREGLIDGTIDMIATDHAPHSAEEKAKGLRGSAFGVVGIETAFPVMYTEFVKTGILTLNKLMELMCFAPRKRFGLDGNNCDFSVWDVSRQRVIDPSGFLSCGRATPFAGRKVYGRCLLTVRGGKTVYEDREGGC